MYYSQLVTEGAPHVVLSDLRIIIYAQFNLFLPDSYINDCEYHSDEINHNKKNQEDHHRQLIVRTAIRHGL